LTEKHLNIWN